MHWQRQKDEHEWKMQHIKPQFSPNDGECRQYLLDKAKSKIESLESFLKAVQTFGGFFIWDNDPSKPEGGQVFYNMRHSKPYVAIRAHRPPDEMHQKKRFTNGDKLSQWLDQQRRLFQVSPSQRSETAP
jgi:hypothetical protein